MDLPHHIFLATKAATHQLPNYTYTFLRPTHHTRHLRPILIRNLRTNVNLHPSIGQRHSDTTFRFKKGVVGGCRMEDMFKDHVRLSEAFVHVTLADLDVLEQISLFVDWWNSLLTRLHWICDHGLEVEFRFDQSRGLFGDLLRFRGDNRQCIPYIADALSDTNHHRPIVDNQSMILFARNILSGEDRDDTFQ